MTTTTILTAKSKKPARWWWRFDGGPLHGTAAEATPDAPPDALLAFFTHVAGWTAVEDSSHNRDAIAAYEAQLESDAPRHRRYVKVSQSELPDSHRHPNVVRGALYVPDDDPRAAR